MDDYNEKCYIDDILLNLICFNFSEFNRDALGMKIKKIHEKLILDYRNMRLDHDSPYLDSMREAIIYLAIYMALKDHLELSTICKIIHEYYEGKMNEMDCGDIEAMREQIFSEDNVKLMEKTALESQTRKFADDYIVLFVKGVDESFVFGNDTLQCPIYLFFKRQNSLEFLKCICDIDFIRSRHFKSGLFRDKCLGKGDDCCTFRWKNIK